MPSRTLPSTGRRRVALDAWLEAWAVGFAVLARAVHARRTPQTARRHDQAGLSVAADAAAQAVMTQASAHASSAARRRPVNVSVRDGGVRRGTALDCYQCKCTRTVLPLRQQYLWHFS